MTTVMGVFIKIIKSDQVDTQIRLEILEKNVEMLRQMVEQVIFFHVIYYFLQVQLQILSLIP